MHELITGLLLWIPMALLGILVFKTGWLDARSTGTGLLAERLLWGSFLATALATVGWVLLGRDGWTSTLTGAGLIGLRVDALSLPMLGLITFLGAVIVRFSRNYLDGDAHQGYFFKWLLVTLGAVAALVLSPGLVQFWLSWVVCSMGLHRLLVYFPDRLGTLLSARKKFVVSRLGDLALIVAFLGMVRAFGTQDFGMLFAMVEAHPELMAGNAWIGWLIVGGALLKSAQFPFHTWLPDTMGAPTPVSALMHAGIINAGGYLVIRMSPFLVQTPGALTFLAVMGAVTLAGASLVMLTQTSVKRALAYSTIAQMGFMLLQCGLGAFPVATLHLIAHSLYKAHAFLNSGSSVELIKGLEERPGGAMSPALRGILVVAGLGMAAGLSWLWGLEFTSKAGLLVLVVVLAMAMAQFLVARLQRDRSLMGSIRAFAITAAVGALYLGLADFAFRYFEGTLPSGPVAGPVGQAVLASALGLFFCLTISLQQGASQRWLPYVRALHVHALNGFYLNTLANRWARSAGLVPPGR